MRALHLGWDDYKLHPGHLARKRRYGGEYREVDMIERPPSLAELAIAGPLIAETRRAGVADTAVLELAWTETPPVAASVPGAVAVHRPATASSRSPTAQPVPCCCSILRANMPPSSSARRAASPAAQSSRWHHSRRSTGAPQGVVASGLARTRASGPGDIPLRFASALDSADLELTTLDDRERWLDLFASAAFGSSERRLWVWQPLEPGPLPDTVLVDPARVTLWEPVAPEFGRKLRPLRERVLDRLAPAPAHRRRARADPRRPAALLSSSL